MYIDDDASPTVTNCTFAGNSATKRGGGINVNGSSATPAVVNTILWGNTGSRSGKGPDVYSEYGATVSLKNCVVDGVYDKKSGLFKRENCVTADPLLVACDAAGNEGNGIASTDIRFYRPGRNGSAIGKGLSVGKVTVEGVEWIVPDTDQLGRARPGADSKVDIGAWEHDGSAPNANAWEHDGSAPNANARGRWGWGRVLAVSAVLAALVLLKQWGWVLAVSLALAAWMLLKLLGWGWVLAVSSALAALMLLKRWWWVLTVRFGPAALMLPKRWVLAVSFALVALVLLKLWGWGWVLAVSSALAAWVLLKRK